MSGGRASAGASSYTHCHLQCHCERRRLLKKKKEVEEGTIKYLMDLTANLLIPIAKGADVNAKKIDLIQKPFR